MAIDSSEEKLSTYDKAFLAHLFPFSHLVKQQQKMGLIFSLRIALLGEYNILFKAAKNGNEHIIKLLLDREGTQVKKKGNSALLWASHNGHDRVVKLLLEKEYINVNFACEDGFTPLIWAARYGHVKVVEVLLGKEDIEVNKTKNSGSAPLHAAAYYGHNKVVKLLLKQEGIQINEANHL